MMPSSLPVFDWLADSVRVLGFDAKPDADAFQLLLALGAALVAYALIHRSQKKAAEEGRRIERARLLHDLDREYYDIMSRQGVVAVAPGAAPETGGESLRLEWVLTGQVKWIPGLPLDASGGRRYCNIDGSRHVRISDAHYIDTISLHLMLAWFKRVSNGLRLEILSRGDVMEMWRNVLPWAKNNRFSYMADLFGTSQAREDDMHAVFTPARRRTGSVRSLLAARFRQRRVHGSLFRETPPDHWRGDIAALYHLVHAVIEEALHQERLEILDYLRAQSPGAPLWSAVDAPLRTAMIA